jgi:putative hemolysin
MDPDSCINLIDNSFSIPLFFLILFFHLLIVTVYAVYRYQSLNLGLITMTTSDNPSTITETSPAAPRNLNTLSLATRLSSVFTGILTALLLMDVFCTVLTPWMLAAIAVGVVLALLLLDGIASGIGARFTQTLAPSMQWIARIILFLYQPFVVIYDSLKPNTVRDNIHFSDMESSLREWMDKQPDDTPLKVDKRKMVRSILHFNDTLIREIMIPRIEMTAIDVESSLDFAAEQVLSSGHSRLPVYDDDIDNIVGVMYAKDLLKVYREATQEESFDLRAMARPALFVPEAKKAGDLLAEMQASGIHIVIVVDEYGGTAGLVSMEDIVEEIVGEIRDEYDQTEEVLVQLINEHEYSFFGRIDLGDVNEILHTHITRDAADTLAGFMYSKIGRVPTGEEIVIVEGWQFQVEKLVGNRILRVSAKPAAPAIDEAEQEAYEENNDEE